MFLTDENVLAASSAKSPELANLLPSSKYMQIESLLDRGDRQAFLEMLAEIGRPYTPEISIRDPMAFEIFISVSMILISHMNRWNLHSQLSHQTGYYRLFRADEFSTWNEAWNFVKSLTMQIFDAKDNERKQRASDTISNVCMYIQDHIEDELTQVRLADLVHFSPSYLSKLFKQKTGSTLSDYIKEKKIAKAKQFLEHTSMSIQEIGESLGYGYALILRVPSRSWSIGVPRNIVNRSKEYEMIQTPSNDSMKALLSPL